MNQHEQANSLAGVVRAGLFGSRIDAGSAVVPDGRRRWASSEERARWAVPVLGSKVVFDLLRGLGMVWVARDMLTNKNEEGDEEGVQGDGRPRVGMDAKSSEMVCTTGNGKGNHAAV